MAGRMASQVTGPLAHHMAGRIASQMTGHIALLRQFSSGEKGQDEKTQHWNVISRAA